MMKRGCLIAIVMPFVIAAWGIFDVITSGIGTPFGQLVGAAFSRALSNFGWTCFVEVLLAVVLAVFGPIFVGAWNMGQHIHNLFFE